MPMITFSQLRYRVADVLLPKFNDVFVSIYQSNIDKYSEKTIADVICERRSDTLYLLQRMLKIQNQSELEKLFKETDPEIIVCFYMRYWILINKLEPLSHSNSNVTLVPDNDDEMVNYLLFQFIEDPRVSQ